MKYKEVAEKLCKKYQTRDPFEIARQLGIQVFYGHYGTIRGYYNKISQQRMIHINAALDEPQQTIVCAHELGHAIFHPNTNTPFLRANTFFSVSKLELEANKFAVDLLWSDDDLRECQLWTIPRLRCCWVSVKNWPSIGAHSCSAIKGSLDVWI